MTTPTETWLPIPGYAGTYEVSSLGRVRSFRRRNPRVLSQWVTRTGHLKVRIGGRSETGRYVHQLVLSAFVGPRPEGMIARHLNGDPTDNRPENLAWGTHSENNYDAVRHGTHAESSRTHCKRGHEFSPENTREHDGTRFCRTCARDWMRKVRTTDIRERNAELRAWAAANGLEVKPAGPIPVSVRTAYRLASSERQERAA